MRNLPLRLTCAFLSLILLPSPVMADKSKEKVTVGWVEKVYIEAIDTKAKAKLDTGAKTSSLGAEIIDIVEYTKENKVEERAKSKNKKSYPHGKVIFSILDDDGNKKTLERTIVRFVKIKKKGTAGFIRRPVIRMRFCLAGHIIEDEVNLAVRTRFIYPVLIGRNMLEKGGLVVDASRMLTAPATCPRKKAD